MTQFKILFISLLVSATLQAQVKKQNEIKPIVADSTENKIAMHDSIKEINIVAVRPLVKTTANKTIYDVLGDADARTSNMLEILKKMPHITIDGSDNISLNGSSCFLIYLNGKPSTLISKNPREMLRGMPAGSVKRVEIITEPGARYDAEGVSGIINIVTKNAGYEGYNGSLYGTALTRIFAVGGYGMIKYGKFSLSGDYSYSSYGQKIAIDYQRTATIGKLSTLESHSAMKLTTPSHSGAIEASYEIDSLNLLSFSSSFSPSRYKTRQMSDYRISDGTISSYSLSKYGHEDWGGTSFRTDFQHKFRNNEERMLTFSWLYDYAPNSQKQLSILSNVSGEPLSYLSNYNLQNNNAHENDNTFQLDYVTPFGKVHKAEGGLKYIHRSSVSHAFSNVKDNEADEWLQSSLQPKLAYNHTQNILAAYADYTYDGNPFSLEAGIRMERTWQDVNYSEGEGKSFTWHATDWVPSIFISRNLGESSQLRFGYNLRLKRPGIDRLNPYIVVSGSGISYGNPELTTQKHHRITASWNMFNSRINIEATALATYSTHAIGTYQFIDGNSILNSTFGNIENFKGGAITFFLGWNPFSRTNITFNSILGYLSIHPDKEWKEQYNGISNKGFNGSFNLELAQKFNHDWRLRGTFGLTKQEITIGMNPELYHYYGLMLTKKLLNDKIEISVRAQNFLTKTTSGKSTEHYQTFDAKTKTFYYGQAFGLTFNYNFGNLKLKVKHAEHTITNDDILKKQ